MPTNENTTELKKEAISIDEVQYVDRTVFPHFSFAKMSGNHRVEAEFMYSHHKLENDFYNTDSHMIDDYAPKTDSSTEQTEPSNP